MAWLAVHNLYVVADPGALPDAAARAAGRRSRPAARLTWLAALASSFAFGLCAVLAMTWAGSDEPLSGSAGPPPAAAPPAVTLAPDTPVTIAPLPGHAPPGAAARAGEAACDEARGRAEQRDIAGAAASFRDCSGLGRASALGAIRAQAPRAVRDAVYRDECGKARSMAAAGARAGAPAIDVDRDYPRCRGR